MFRLLKPRLAGLMLAFGNFSAELAQAQQLPSQLDKADEFFRKLDFARAITLYEERVAKNPSELIYRRLAESYRHLGNYKQEEQALVKLSSLPSHTPDDLYKLGRSLESNQKYQDAVRYYEVCLQSRKPPRPPFIINERIRMCRLADSIYSMPSAYKVENEQKLNTLYSDFGAIRTGNRIYFASDRPSTVREQKGLNKPLSAVSIYGWTGRPYVKIFSSSLAMDTLSELASSVSTQSLNPVPGINFHQGPAVFSKDGNRMYFTRTSHSGTGLSVAKPGAAHPDLGKAKTRILFINHLEIWFTDKSGVNWSAPRPFPFNDSKRYSAGHPSLSDDGKTLYFSSDMPGTRGGMDLYASSIAADGSFSKPVNLGERVNTTGNELFPSIRGDSTLYFASDGHNGLGGLDIFKTSFFGGVWTTPQNLGAPVNSASDDFDFQPFGSRSDSGFFASNRDGGKGNDDIYSFKRARNLFLKVFVKNLESGKTLFQANVSFEEGSRKDRSLTNIDGFTYFKVLAGGTVQLKGSHEGYFDTTSTYKPTSSEKIVDTLETTLLLRQKIIFKKIDSIGLEKLYYDFNKSNIRPDAVPILDRLATFLRNNPALRIQLSSHTDSRGSDSYNLKLSQRRAASAVNYLIAHGISKGRLTAKGFGETVPVNECINGVTCTEAQFQQNRRTEVTILKTGAKSN